MYTCRLTIRPPTDFPLLEKWNEQIKADTVLITVEANLKRIRSVMQRNNVRFSPYVNLGCSKWFECGVFVVHGRRLFLYSNTKTLCTGSWGQVETISVNNTVQSLCERAFALVSPRSHTQ